MCVALTLSYFLQPTGTEDDRGGLQRSPGQESPSKVQVSFTGTMERTLNNVSSCHTCYTCVPFTANVELAWVDRSLDVFTSSKVKVLSSPFAWYQSELSLLLQLLHRFHLQSSINSWSGRIQGLVAWVQTLNSSLKNVLFYVRPLLVIN